MSYELAVMKASGKPPTHPLPDARATLASI
jgi:hypothetical protein